MNENKKTGPRDVFLHLLGIIFLYASVLSIGGVLFQIVNTYFPNPLVFEGALSARNAIRWPLSVAVIIFPLYVWVTAFIQKDLARNPEKRALKTRKWLLYLTLFVTTLVIAGDLVTLIFRYLNGDITIRFLLKVCIVLSVAAAVFVYYIWNLRKDIPATKNLAMKVFIYGVIGFIGASVAAGFVLAGSPQSERMRRFDERRVNDLQTIQWQIVQYWQSKQNLPQSLDELRDDLRGFIPPRDPETDAPYEYAAVEILSFTLCAEFKTSNEVQNMQTPHTPAPKRPYLAEPRGSVTESWAHAARRQCFERTIDPQLYPPFSKSGVQ